METTKIAWADATFNAWWGCVEVSPACDHCYARTTAHRYGFPVWGKDAPRRFFTPKHWEQPLIWNKKALKAGIRRRVFCSSMADILEERSDEMGELMEKERRRLWNIIHGTPNLDWLLLSKRADGYRRLVPPEILALKNVWPGTTVETQDYLWRAGKLLDLQCAGPRWISYEPALGPVDFWTVLCDIDTGPRTRISWIVVGGESGFTAPLGHDRPRPFDLQWARDTLRQCREAGIAYFMKQTGVYPVLNGVPVTGISRKGDVMEEWPEDLQVQEFPA